MGHRTGAKLRTAGEDGRYGGPLKGPGQRYQEPRPSSLILPAQPLYFVANLLPRRVVEQLVPVAVGQFAQPRPGAGAAGAAERIAAGDLDRADLAHAAAPRSVQHADGQEMLARPTVAVLVGRAVAGLLDSFATAVADRVALAEHARAGDRER